MSPRWHRAAIACAGIGLLFLTGCGLQERQENEERSAGYGRQIEEDLPSLVRAAGWDSIGALREESCNDSPVREHASSTTRWFATAGRRDISQDEAQSVLESVREHAESTGWNSKESTGGPQLLYTASQDDLTLVVRHSTSSGPGLLGVEIATPCLEMPEGHTMSRSELDPMYGSPDSLYPNDDRSKFTNGKAKP
ncbi:hypothetical protein F7P69_12680 [Cellulosimicrobium funkei]|nr:hypothetical protein [Cellulosimicrobium funkei]